MLLSGGLRTLSHARTGRWCVATRASGVWEIVGRAREKVEHRRRRRERRRPRRAIADNRAAFAIIVNVPPHVSQMSAIRAVAGELECVRSPATCTADHVSASVPCPRPPACGSCAPHLLVTCVTFSCVSSCSSSSSAIQFVLWRRESGAPIIR